MNLIFGTDGIRGIANRQISANLAFFVGKSLAIRLLQNEKKQQKIVVGQDTRVSGDMIVCALSAGVMSMGVDVINLGILTTPALSFLTKSTQSDFGVMITASHNPAEFNGIKIFDSNGFKLSIKEEQQIESIFDNVSSCLPGDKVGRMFKRPELIHDYLTFLIDSIGSLPTKQHRIALDCANGAGSKIIPFVFKSLVDKCDCFNTDFETGEINGKCGSVDTQNFVKTVKGNFDVGFAFDGDADRVVAVLKDGQVLSGEQILFVFVKYLKQHNKLKNNKVVTTILTNIGIEDSLSKLGVETIRCDVGDRNILEEMQKQDCNLGGEESGHIILSDLNPTSDGALAGLMLLKILVETDFDLSLYLKDAQIFDTVKLNVNVSARQKSKFKTDVLDDFVTELSDELGAQGRLIVRPSGTESVIRILVEGKDKNLMLDIAKRLEQQILAL